MDAQVLEPGDGGGYQLLRTSLSKPRPQEGELLIRVAVCGVCHTELDELAGRIRPRFTPLVPGHQAVGVVEEVGAGVRTFGVGDRAAVAWIYHCCGVCQHCLSGRENLCGQFLATGADANGGYSEYLKVDEAFAFHVADALSDEEAAPLLCGGAIGYRALRLAGLDGEGGLGLMGFGASAHLVLQFAKHQFPEMPIVVFARKASTREFARECGADWAGGIEDVPPLEPDAIIDTTPAWLPVLQGLKALAPGGRLVINAIRKSDADREVLAGLSYPEHLWREKAVKSVANVTREDVRAALTLAATSGIRPTVREYPLEEAGAALADVAAGSIHGAIVLRVSAGLSQQQNAADGGG